MEFRDHIDRVLRVGGAEPSRIDWAVAVFAVLVQQNAFVSTPLVLSNVPLSAQQDLRNPYNTAAIAISIVSIAMVCLPWLRRVCWLGWTNRVTVLFMAMVLTSAIWSIHPDLTIRRGIGYVVTILVAAYLSLRFNVIDRMRVLSASFAISAAASLLFIAAFPAYGIMQDGDLAGDWRGVFLHKNVFGPAMAVAVFTELFLLFALKGRPRWRFATMGTYLVLVVLSRSESALLLSLVYLAGAGIYFLWRRNRSLGYFAFYAVAACVAVFFTVAWIAPNLALGILGRDATLTGRTELWSSVVPLVEQRPVVGWGYQAMWQANDAATILIDRLAGWTVPNSHNAFLEIALQLGLVSMGLLLAIIVIAFRRSLKCCAAGILPLGWFSFLFFVGAILAGQTETTLGQNQAIEWVVFNVLSFSCGLAFVSQRVSDLANARRGGASRNAEAWLVPGGELLGQSPVER
jgi:exopolysaccharide production protein ExoQ